MTVAELWQAIARDLVLAKVLQLTQMGWSPTVSEETMKPYFERRHKFTVEQGCVMRGIRVVIPHNLQGRVLDELHGGHIGVVKMKALARSNVVARYRQGDRAEVRGNVLAQ